MIDTIHMHISDVQDMASCCYRPRLSFQVASRKAADRCYFCKGEREGIHLRHHKDDLYSQRYKSFALGCRDSMAAQ